MAYAITHKLEVYNRSGTSVALTITSIAGGTNPYLSTVPDGDGQEINPLTGGRRAGQYTGLIVDAVTSGTDRIVTANLEDSGFRQQLMGRKAVLSQIVDGTDTEVLCAGKLTGLRLVNTVEYEYTITDNTVLAGSQKIFAPKSGTVTLAAGASAGATSLSCDALPIALVTNTVLNFGGGKTAVVSADAAAGATSFSVTAIPSDVDDGDIATYRESIAAFYARWPKRGCAFGGPITGGGFLDLPSTAGWLFRLQSNAIGTGRLLRFLAGSGPPTFQQTITDITHPSILPATNARVGPWTPRGGTSGTGTQPLPSGKVHTFDQAERSGFANDLVVEVLSRTGSRYGFYSPGIGAITLNEEPPGLLTPGHNGSGGVAAWEPGVWLQGLASTATADGLPAFGTSVRARAFTASVSEVSPIYLEMHPVTVATTVLNELGYAYDATTATTMIETLGADLVYRNRITEPQTGASWLAAEILGPFGIGLRMGDDGELEFFPLRIMDNAVPATEITSADVVAPSEVGGDVFAIAEATAIAEVVVEFNALARVSGNDPETPPDGIVVRPTRVERKNGDPGVVGDRVHTWSMTGMVGRLNGNYKPDATYWDAPIKEVFDRYGRGVIECVLPLLYGGSASDLKIGEEAVITLPQFPNKNKRYGDDNTVGGRAMQLVRLTRYPWGAIGKFVDSGPNAQPFATAPTISIAASSEYPETVAELTVTNAATLNAAGAGARVRMAVVDSGGSAPAATDYADVVSFPVGQIPTGAFQLPAVLAGKKVYAKVRAETVADRPSDYSSTANVTLTAYTAPSAVTAAADGSDGTQATATWTVGESTLRTDVFIRETSGTTASDDQELESLQPGADRYTFRWLKPDTEYTVSVRHRDSVTGDVTAKATDTVTTGSAPAALTAPTGERGFVGKQDFAIDIPNEPGVCGIAVRSDAFPMDVEAYMATETAVGGGSYGDFGFVNRVPARQGTWTPIYVAVANDGKRRQFKARHVRPAMHRGAAAMMVAEMAALSVAEAASLYAGSHTSAFGSTVTVTPYSNTAIQKTTKTLRLGPHNFLPATSSTPYSRQSNSLNRANNADVPQFYANVILPTGSQLIEWRMSTAALSSVNVAATLWRGNGASSSTNVSSLATSGSGSLETDSDTLSVTLDGSDYAVDLLISGGGTTNITEFLHIEIDYTSPALDVSL